MLASQLELIRIEIRAAFPPVAFDGPITSCDCAECTHLRDGLRDKRWDHVPAAFLDFTCSPTLLTPEAFQTFLPAYMLRGLDDLTGERAVLEFTIYSLCPDLREEEGDLARQIKETRLHELVKLMTPAQIQAIRNFLTFVAGNAKDAEWLGAFIDIALEKIWRGSPTKRLS